MLTNGYGNTWAGSANTARKRSGEQTLEEINGACCPPENDAQGTYSVLSTSSVSCLLQRALRAHETTKPNKRTKRKFGCRVAWGPYDVCVVSGNLGTTVSTFRKNMSRSMYVSYFKEI